MRKYIVSKTQTLRSNSISSIPWEKAVCNDTESTKEFVDDFGIKGKEESILNQLMAWFSSSAFQLVRNENNLVSPTLTSESIKKSLINGSLQFPDGTPVTPQMFIGIMNYIRTPSRSSILASSPSQTTPTVSRRYCAAVPLFLSAFKEFRNVKYSEWDAMDDNISKFVDKANIEMLQAPHTLEIDYDDSSLLDLRDKGLTYVTGVKAGTMRTHNQGYSINKTGDQSFDALPTRLKVALCRTWLFQEHLRHPLGIYSVKNPDDVNEPVLKDTRDLDYFTTSSELDKNTQNPQTSSTSSTSSLSAVEGQFNIGDIEW